MQSGLSDCFQYCSLDFRPNPHLRPARIDMKDGSTGARPTPSTEAPQNTLKLTQRQNQLWILTNKGDVSTSRNSTFRVRCLWYPAFGFRLARQPSRPHALTDGSPRTSTALKTLAQLGAVFENSLSGFTIFFNQLLDRGRHITARFLERFIESTS